MTHPGEYGSLDRRPGVDDFPCPCCGHREFDGPPGSHEICSACFWEDDLVQLRWPDWAGGANRPSLRDAQRNVTRYGAMEERFVRDVRTPGDGDPVDDGWRPIGPEDRFEPPGVQERPSPADPTVLYWWRPTFWRR